MSRSIGIRPTIVVVIAIVTITVVITPIWVADLDLYAWTGGDVGQPMMVDLEMLEDWKVEHWEALDMTPLNDAGDPEPA